MKTVASWAATFGLASIMCCSLALCGVACNEAPTTESGSDSSSDGESSESTESGSTGTESGSDEESTESSESGSGESTESTGEPVCGPGEGTMFDQCHNSCDCADGMACRYNYPGGYLSECTEFCTEDAECENGGACSGGYCILPCGPNRECAEGTYCYPGTLLDGTPIVDPAHPVPHCIHPTEG